MLDTKTTYPLWKSEKIIYSLLIIRMWAHFSEFQLYYLTFFNKINLSELKSNL